MLNKKEDRGKYICGQCRELSDFDYGAKDMAALHTCYICGRWRYCRLSDLRKVLCRCQCPCRACKSIRRPRS
jgi:hypothetical protein